MQSPKKKPKRRLSWREKGKKKIPEYGSKEGTSDWSKFDKDMSGDGEPQELRLDSTKRALKSANEKLHDQLATRTP